MPPVSDRSAMAKAVEWATRIMTVSLEMVLPGIVGVLIDRYLGTIVVFTLVGFALGFTAAGFHLVAMTRQPHTQDPPPEKENPFASPEKTED